MVTDGGIESTVLKAKYGSDIRKSQLHHNNDLTYNDLLLMMQRIFKIKPSTSVILKYRDTDGDLITLIDDNDLIMAIRTEKSLYVEVFTDSDDLAGKLSQLDALLSNINESAKALKKSLQTTHVHSISENHRSSIPLPYESVKHNESVATIQPSVHEQVDNGNISHMTNSFSESLHVKNEFEEELPASRQSETYKPVCPMAQPQQPVFLNQLENVPIDNNGHQHSPAEEALALNQQQMQQQLQHLHDLQLQQMQQQQMHARNFSPTVQLNEQYRATPHGLPVSQATGFQQPPSSLAGYPMGPPSITSAPQFPQQPPQFHKPPTSAAMSGPPPAQQFSLPPSLHQPGAPMTPPGATYQSGMARLPGQFNVGGMGQYGGAPTQRPPQQMPAAPPVGGQFPPAGPAPPMASFGAPPDGSGGFAGAGVSQNPFARVPAPLQAAYMRPTFSNY